MRQGSNSKRSRSKGGGNRGGNGSRHPLNRSFESNGPGGKVRGNPHQVYEKYLSMARDYQAEDPIMAENLLQHADHYFRVIQDANGGKSRRGDGDDKSAGGQTADKDGDGGEGSSGRAGTQADGAEAGDGAAPDNAQQEAEETQQSGEDGNTSGAKRSRRGRKSKSDEDSGTDATASDAA